MIRFEQVSFGYDGRRILDGVDMTLEPGALHFLTGRSGAGKTTLLKLAIAARKPEAGTVTVLGETVAALSPEARAALRRRIGYIAQDCDLLDHLSLIENIALPLRLAGADPAAREADIRDLAGWVGLADRLDARPAQLSSGERRRGQIARALIAAPELILADEPTGDVDAEAAERILAHFIELAASGRGVLVVTHDLGLIRSARGRMPAGTEARTLRLEDGALQRAGAAL